MLIKTKAIVLKYNRYSDSSFIVQLFTEQTGRMAVMVYGIKNKKQSKFTYFQPLFLLDVVVDFKVNRSVQVLKEYKLSPPLINLNNSNSKIAISLFLSDILNKCLQEENPDLPTFEFLSTSIKIFDQLEEGIALFHIVFLIKFSKYLGFSIAEIKDDFKYYDLKKGKFLAKKPFHSFYINRFVFEKIHFLGNLPYNEIHSTKLANNERNELLETLVSMYELHAINFRSILSFEVLKQVFSENITSTL